MHHSILINQACLRISPVWVLLFSRGISCMIALIFESMASPLKLLSLIVSFELPLFEMKLPRYFSLSKNFMDSPFNFRSGHFLEISCA